MKKQDESTITNETSVADGREPYDAPRMEIEELFEVLALACGKTFGNFQCTHTSQTKNS